SLSARKTISAPVISAAASAISTPENPLRAPAGRAHDRPDPQRRGRRRAEFRGGESARQPILRINEKISGSNWSEYCAVNHVAPSLPPGAAGGSWWRSHVIWRLA